MHQTITFGDFCDAFRACGRNEQFNYDALRVLFDYLEDYEEQTGESVELDIIALCCDYSEMTWKEVADNYRVDLSDCEDDDDREDAIRAYLEYHTALCGEFEGPDGVTFVFQQF